MTIGENRAVKSIEDLRCVSEALVALRRDAYLINDGCYDLIKDHALVCGWREDLVKLVCFVAKRTGAHGELDCIALDAVGGDDNAAVLAHFTVVAPATANDNVDVGLLAGVFKVGCFPLEW